MKAVNLALCYVGLSVNGSYREAMKAGTAGFLCCAYDVVSDWRGFRQIDRVRFKRILQELVPSQEAEAVLRLWDLERDGRLSNDGLQRGVIALEFVASVIGSRKWLQSRGDFTRIGMALQIADDVLDYEHDIKCGEMNCLRSVRAYEYLEWLCQCLSESEVRRLFPSSRVLQFVLRRARAKAELWLAETHRGKTGKEALDGQGLP